MSDRQCHNPACEQPIVRRVKECQRDYTRRQYCSVACANECRRSALPAINEARRDKAAERFEDIMWLLDSGESYHETAKRLGVSIRSLIRWLCRYGRNDLANLAQRELTGNPNEPSRRAAA